MITEKSGYKAILISATILIVLVSAGLLITQSCGKEEKVSSDSTPYLYKFQGSSLDFSKREVTLYFPSEEDGLLHPEKRTIFDTESITDQAKQVIVELIKGPNTALKKIIPNGTKLREVFLDKFGTAYVDLTNEIINNLPGGSENEMLLVYSIVNSLTENFTLIKRIRFLVDGREVETLNGHINMVVSFTDRPDLVFNPEKTQPAVTTQEPNGTEDEDEPEND